MSLDWKFGGAVAVVGLATYLMRRHVVFVRPKPCRLASREQLSQWLQTTNKDKGIEICLLTDTQQAHREEELVSTRGFLDYHMYAWWFKVAPKLGPAQRFSIVHLISLIVRESSHESGGFVAVAKRQGKVIASIRVAVEAPGHVDSDLAMAWKFINGTVHFPFSILPQTSTRFFHRMVVSLRHLDNTRNAVTSEFGSKGEYLHLIQIATDPDAQGSGAGGELLQALGRVADQLGRRVYLETNTERLRAFYERNGYELKSQSLIRDDTDTDDAGIDNFGMVRPLQ